MFELIEYVVEDDIPVIYIFGRDKDGKRTIRKDDMFRPYFYCLRNDSLKFSKNKRVLNIQECDFTDIDGRLVSKITCKLPKDIKELRKEINESFEADVSYPTRYTIDNFDEIEGVPLSVCYLDIETNSDKIFPNIQTAQDAITAITGFNNTQKKCVTFVWRQDQQERCESNGKKTFELVDGNIYEYEDFTMYFDDERKMLIKFLKYIVDIDPSMITGWNVRDFDMRYIINRMNNIGIDFNQLSPMGMALTNEWGDVIVKGRIIFDMLDAVKDMSYGEMDSYKLDNVAQHELGERKVLRPLENGKEISYRKFWQTDLPLFIEYNKKDVMLVHRIEMKKKIIQSFDERRRMAKCSFNDVFNNSKVVDAFVLFYCKNKYALPTESGHEKESFGGGKVLKPKKGIYNWVSVYDFKALYPKIISSLNCSPETIAEKKTDKTANLHIPYIDSNMFWKDSSKKKFNNSAYDKVKSEFDEFFENNWNLYKQEFSNETPKEIVKYLKYKDVSFNQDKKGFVPKILEHLFDERIKIQVERDTYEYGSPEYLRLEFKQDAFKKMMNSFYGWLGFYRSRLYRPELAASITFVGRNSVLWNKLIANKKGLDVIYGDTDSSFINFGSKEDLLEKSEKIRLDLQNSYDEFGKFFNISTLHLTIEFEKVYSRIFFGQAKKRYAGKLYWYKGKFTDKVSIVGFEANRSDQSFTARETQKEVFNMILNGNNNKEEIINYVKSIEKSIREDKIPYEKIGIPTPLKKPLSEYKTNLPVVRAISYSNRILKLDIRPGEKILLVYSKNSRGTDVIAIRNNEDVPDGLILDYNKHVDEATKDKMRATFDGLGWSLLELTGQKSLTDY